MVRIWEKMVEADANADLLPIIPLVLYHGESRWNIGPTFDGLFNGAEELRPYWPEFKYQLYDLSQWSDAEIRGALLLRAELLLLKLLRVFVSSRLYVAGWSISTSPCVSVAGGASGGEVQGVVEQVFVEEGEGSMATLFEQWIEQGMEMGRKQGIAEGIEKGKAEGIVEGVHVTLLNLLQHRFGELNAKHKRALARLSPEQVQAVVIKALEAATLADIMDFVAGLKKQSRK
jgi:hypothetical protein